MKTKVMVSSPKEELSKEVFVHVLQEDDDKLCCARIRYKSDLKKMKRVS